MMIPDERPNVNFKAALKPLDRDVTMTNNISGPGVKARIKLAKAKENISVTVKIIFQFYRHVHPEAPTKVFAFLLVSLQTAKQLLHR